MEREHTKETALHLKTLRTFRSMMRVAHNSKLYTFLAVLLLFMYIFDFELIKGVSYSRSSIVALGISSLVLAVSKSKKISLTKLFNPSCMRLAIAFSLALLLYSVSSVLLHHTGDYSLLLSIARSVIWIGATAIVYIAVKQLHQGCILDLLIGAMVIQSAIIVLSMLVPDFKAITDAFRSDSTIERGEKYSGYRALGISGSAFFGLSVCYGYIYLLIAYHWKSWNVSNPIMKICIVILLVVAGSSAGRTSQVGLAIAVLLFLSLRIVEKADRRVAILRKRNIAIVSFSLALIIGSIPILGEISIPRIVEYYITYATSFIANFNPSDILSSTSSTQTLSTMYFPLSVDQLIAGDGLYEINGSYYMDTDAGYMRTILYFGILGLLLMCAVQFSLLFVGSGKKEVLFFLSIVLMMLIFQYKGEAIFTPVSLSALSLLAAFDLRNELLIDEGRSSNVLLSNPLGFRNNQVRKVRATNDSRRY